jgi:hypothetical protein
MLTTRFIRSVFVSVLLLGFTMASLPSRAAAQVAVGVSVSFGPPELPVYEQPLCPGEGYIWTPGYWAWDDDGDDYYWVPGTWVLAPQIGFFWTPGYWAWGGSGFVFYQGYWGPVVGFYGGINYGYGYFGHGYEGGRWDHDRFYYNRTVNNINVTEIHNVYNTTVINNNTTRVSFNGGNGGVSARPTAQEEAAARERHIPPVSAQTQHIQAARTNRVLHASENHGKPPIAATPRPAAFSGSGVVAAREGGRYNPPPRNESKASPSNNHPDRPNEVPSTSRPPSSNTVVHPRDLPPHVRPDAPNTGNPKVDQKYQQEQEKLRAKQEQQHQKLQQKQEQEHQRMEQQRVNEPKKQQLEQRHQQQTQQMEQKHAQEQQKLQQHQQPPHSNPPPSKPPKEKH